MKLNKVCLFLVVFLRKIIIIKYHLAWYITLINLCGSWNTEFEDCSYAGERERERIVVRRRN